MKLSSKSGFLCALPLWAAFQGVGVAQTPYNTLTAEEAAAGYTLLFNGTNLTGWRGWNSVNPPASWAVVAETTWNVIRNGSGSALPLITADSTYQNFDLKLEFYVPSAGNSGVFIRYNQYNRDSWGGASGPETQIAATNNSDGSSAKHRNGTCYDMFGLLPQALNWDRPNNTLNYNRYHQLRIVAFNNRIAHYGNGIKLLEYDMNSTAYNTAYNASKYVTYPIYRTVHQGGIYLQHHGEQNVRFRNLRIKRLTENPWGHTSAYLKSPGDSTGGLVDSMTFAQNFFPPGVGITGKPGAGSGRIEARVARGADGVSILVDRDGDFLVRVDDLRGRNLFKGRVGPDRRLVVPSDAFTAEMRVLRILSADNAEAWRRLISPIR